MMPQLVALARNAVPPLALCLLVQVPAAQAFGSQQIISSKADDPTSILAADLDGDGDQDVLSTFGDSVAWNENTDGLGSFGSPRIITLTAIGAASVFAADLDGDADLDVLSASSVDDTIAWYENQGGQGTFGPAQVVTAALDGAILVSAADLDGDGDQDVLGASSVFFAAEKLAWYENQDGQGTFGPEQVITTAADDAVDVFAADVDGDGDQDVLWASASLGAPGMTTVWNNRIAWHENTDGLGTFALHDVVNFNTWFGVTSIHAADLENDGDLDLIVGWISNSVPSKVSWYRNTDGQGSYGSELVITNQAKKPWSVFAADLDGDGDQDVLSASLLDDTIAWYENKDGVDTFGPLQIITTGADGASSVFAADLNGDGKADVLSASDYDNKIAWYANLEPAAALPYGCGVNPAGSMRLLSGAPSIGSLVTLGVDNPLGTQAPGSLPFVAFATAPDPAFPCGTLLPGFGMGGAGAAAELLVGVAPPPFLILSGSPWAGPGTPAPIRLPIPADTALLGAALYAQGFLVDTSPGASVFVGLTDAVELKVGP